MTRQLDRRAARTLQRLERRTQRGQLSRAERRQLQTLRSQPQRRALRSRPRQERLQTQHRPQVSPAHQSQRLARLPRVTPQAAAQGRFAARFHHGNRQTRRAHLAARLAWRRGLRAAFVPWYGPLFWPYVYSDILEYTFWPQAYDDGYWAYIYDDFFDSIFWPYGSPYSDYVAAGLPPAQPRATKSGAVPRPPAAAIALCRDPGNGITAWPFTQIETAVRPDAQQRALLQDLRDAAAQAAQAFKMACPSDYAMTPPGRLQAMIGRLQATLAAVRIVRPALEKFYNALSDEQKARFNALGPDFDQAGKNADKQALAAQDCGDEKPGLVNFPIDRIDEVVQPQGDQEAALERLSTATQKAVETLHAACPNVVPLTPVGRLETMEKRLDAMVSAANAVLPALEGFYTSLSNEQKARFNTLKNENKRG